VSPTDGFKELSANKQYRPIWATRLSSCVHNTQCLKSWRIFSTLTPWVSMN